MSFKIRQHFIVRTLLNKVCNITSETTQQEPIFDWLWLRVLIVGSFVDHVLGVRLWGLDRFLGFLLGRPGAVDLLQFDPELTLSTGNFSFFFATTKTILSVFSGTSTGSSSRSGFSSMSETSKR